MDAYPPSNPKRKNAPASVYDYSSSGPVLSQSALYDHLKKVSRSFALTIPLMPAPLRDYISLAYLICRIVDTVEDDAQASTVDKITWLSDFSFLAGDEFEQHDVLLGLRQRALELTQAGSNENDVALIADLERAINLLLSFPEEVKEVICHGVAILGHGMASAQRKSLEEAQIINLDDVDNYCYFVAGVVGEMLAELFSLSDKKADKKDLMELAVSFGEGLQLTNILRDRAKDSERGVTFLPASSRDEVLDYVALTQGHLDDAIDFICTLSPKESAGVRLFCLTNVAMAMYLLRKVARNPLDPECNYKISRANTKRLFILCRLAVRANWSVHALSLVLSLGMKSARRSARQLRDKVSIWDHSSTTN